MSNERVRRVESNGESFIKIRWHLQYENGVENIDKLRRHKWQTAANKREAYKLVGLLAGEDDFLALVTPATAVQVRRDTQHKTSICTGNST